MSELIFAFDYDGTITADKELFDKIIFSVVEAGHRVLIATMRYRDEEDETLRKYFDQGIEIYYTERQAKMNYLSARGIHPNIWIDDNPHWILMNSA